MQYSTPSGPWSFFLTAGNGKERGRNWLERDLLAREIGANDSPRARFSWKRQMQSETLINGMSLG